MPSLTKSRQLATLLVDSLRAEAPIGWSQPGKRWSFNGNAVRWQSTRNAPKSGITNSKQQGGRIQSYTRTRSSSTWQSADIATSPKRSDSKPLLGALFGASALAYLGSSFVPKDEHGDENITIHANESISIGDVEGG